MAFRTVREIVRDICAGEETSSKYAAPASEGDAPNKKDRVLFLREKHQTSLQDATEIVRCEDLFEAIHYARSIEHLKDILKDLVVRTAG